MQFNLGFWTWCILSFQKTADTSFNVKKLAQREYKRRHDTVANLIHWILCEKDNVERKEKWYEHCPEGVVEDDDVKVIWDINIQCDNVMEARRPNLIFGGQKGEIMVHH